MCRKRRSKSLRDSNPARGTGDRGGLLPLAAVDAGARSFAKRLQALPDGDLAVLLSRRPEVTALAGHARPDWDELASILTQPRAATLALTRLDRFRSQALQLACLAGGRLSAAAAAAEGLGRADLVSAASELERWGLAFGDTDGALVVPPEVARLIWNPGGLGPPAARLLEHLTVEDLRAIALRLGLRGAGLPKRRAELAEAVGRRLADREAIAAILHGAPAAARGAVAQGAALG